MTRLYSRRRFLELAGAGGVMTAAAARRSASGAVPDKRAGEPRVPATAKGPRPLPELVPESDLPVFELDVAASRAKQTLILRDGKRYDKSPPGCVIMVPAGARIPLNGWTWKIREKHSYVPGARLIIRGAPGGRTPVFYSPKGRSVISVKNSGNLKGQGIPVGLDLENLHVRGGTGGNAVNSIWARYIRLSRVIVEGGRNGLTVSNGPAIVVVEDSEFLHGGMGDGLTHCVYVSHAERFVARNSRFHSAKAQGHAFKCYAANIDMRGCLVATWLSRSDRDGGFHGLLPPVDMGAWANTVLGNNIFVRRGPARSTCIEYRNRQYAPGFSKWMEPGWGTRIVDYRLVDNRDEDNPHIFRHVLAGNRFENGILPDGSLDPGISRNRGVAVRNNGAGPWGSHGGIVEKTTKPAGWQAHNERAVVWAWNNTFAGIPFRKKYDPVPYKRPLDLAPIREVDKAPHWARRLGLGD